MQRISGAERHYACTESSMGCRMLNIPILDDRTRAEYQSLEHGEALRRRFVGA